MTWTSTRWMVAFSIAIAVMVGALAVSLKNELIDNPLGVDAPQSLVAVRRLLTPAQVRSLKEVSVVEDIAAFSASQLMADIAGRREMLTVAFVTPNYFNLVHTSPLHGRFFSSPREDEGAVSEERWNDLSRSATGPLVLRVSGRTIRVVAAVSDALRPPSGIASIDLYLPLSLQGIDSLLPLGTPEADSPSLLCLARLRRGVSRRVADETLSAALGLPPGGALRDLASAWLSERSLHDLSASMTLFTYLCIGVIITAVTAACIAMASTVHAQRYSLFTMEALGAPLGALLWRATRDNLASTLVGAAVGIGASAISTHLLTGTRLTSDVVIPSTLSPSLYGALAVCALVLLAVFATALMFLLGRSRHMAWSSSRYQAMSRLSRLGGGSLFLQSALAVSMMVPASLLLSSAIVTLHQPLGFSANNVGWITAYLSVARLSPDARRSLTADLLRGLSAYPGITAAAASSAAPLGSIDYGFYVYDANGSLTTVGGTFVSSTYFDVMGIPLIGGVPALRDNEAVVSRSAADRLGLRSPLGHVVNIKFLGQFRISGSVEDATLNGLATKENIFLPLTATTLTNCHLIFRSSRIAALLPGVEQLMNRLAPNIPFSRAVAADQHVRRYFSNVVTNAALGTIAAALSIVLSLIALCVVSARLAQLLRLSLALRAALGASPGSLAATIARLLLPWLLSGALSGVLLALVLLRSAGIDVDVYKMVPLVVSAALVPVAIGMAVGLRVMLTDLRLLLLLR